MKKQYRHTDLSDRECHHGGCKTLIKLNVLLRNPEARSCYLHGLLEKGKTHIKRGGRPTPIRQVIARRNRRFEQHRPTQKA